MMPPGTLISQENDQQEQQQQQQQQQQPEKMNFTYSEHIEKTN